MGLPLTENENLKRVTSPAYDVLMHLIKWVYLSNLYPGGLESVGTSTT